MATFRYKAMTATGTTIRGVLNASTQEAAIHHIRSLGQFPLYATEAGKNSFIDLLFRPIAEGRKLSSVRLARITEELAALLQAGLELDRALGVLIGLDEAKPLRASLQSIRAAVRDGATFADALENEGRFPKFFLSSVRAGEMGGSLEKTLSKLAEHLARSAAIRETVVSALVYPSILLVTAGFSVIAILIFVLPQFEPLFADAGQELPLSTRVVMGIGQILRSYWWALLATATAGAMWFRHGMKAPDFRREVHRFYLRVPVLGKLLAAIEIERFFRTLGTLLANGVPLPLAISLANGTFANAVLAEAVSDVATRLREGERLADRLERTKLFPDSALDLMRIGEESGKLEDMLLRQADLDAQRVKHSIDRLLALLVPLLTIMMGLIVAGLIASMLTAILSVNDIALQ